MKTIYKSIIAAIALVPAMTSCVEEVFPTSGMTEEQLTTSSKSTEALVYGMSAYMNNFATLGSDYAYDWGYGSLMHIRDVMTEDMPIISSGYDWFTAWEQCTNIGEEMAVTQFVWNLYTQLVLTTNLTISAINPEVANDQQLCFLGSGYAFRASHYLDMARMYEFLPTAIFPDNKNLEGNDVLYLTVPIVTEKTTEEQSRNNPRVSREVMFDFIKSDLEKAEEYIVKGTVPDKNLPDLAVIYGLYARLYMWVENYPMAAEYARKAINEFGPGNVTTQDQWLSTSSGFNDLSTPSWMWGIQCVKEERVVTSGILNWTSWMSNETTYGYAAAGPYTMINAATYDAIPNTDFRKLSYVAPEGSPLAGREPVIDREFVNENLQPYCSLKFRPGEGNMTDYNVGSATAYPLMRLEEMYLIEAEAIAHTSPAQGLQLLTDFMKSYRNSSYSSPASGEENVVREIFFQKSVEFWGEGLIFFDLKRLGYSVTRNYAGTNFYESAALNTDGRPAWLNFCIVRTEAMNNEALNGWNNPDPSNKYSSEIQ